MTSRRQFLSNVGAGALLAGLGPELFSDLGLANPMLLDVEDDELTFGELEALVSMLEEVPLDQLLPKLAAELRRGTSTKTLTAAGALANSRTFGGQDYDGYHAFMALMPAYEMSNQLSGPKSALPVLKVLYRSSARMRARGGGHVLSGARQAGKRDDLRARVRQCDYDGADASFTAYTSGSRKEAYSALQEIVREDIDVHRVVLSWRAWDLRRLTGEENGDALLRQSLRHCVDVEERRQRRGKPEPEIRRLLPKLVDEHGLQSPTLGSRDPGDEGVDRLAWTVFGSGRAEAAGAVAAALAEGVDPEAIGEALSVASTRLLLHDPGRAQAESGHRPKGSVHGASVGVHASDSAHAWRNIARVGGARDTVASLIVGAYHTAGQSHRVRKDPIPFAEHLSSEEQDPTVLLSRLRGAIDDGDQLTAAAVAHRYATNGPAAALFAVLIEYAARQDGALHAEKYYRTAQSVHQDSREVFRPLHLAAAARVVASQTGRQAAGVAEAERLLKS